jgi:GNAT superfamily N-acetyltransferase
MSEAGQVAEETTQASGDARAVRVEHVAEDAEVVTKLVAELQAEYVLRYGGGDATPVAEGDFAPPTGAFLVLYVGDEPAACGALRRHDAHDVEVKRLFVRRSHRGQGLARRLMSELERTAAALGYRRVLVETGLAQPEAIGLYESLGYARVPGFGHYRRSPQNRCYAKSC